MIMNFDIPQFFFSVITRIYFFWCTAIYVQCIGCDWSALLSEVDTIQVLYIAEIPRCVVRAWCVVQVVHY